MDKYGLHLTEEGFEKIAYQKAWKVKKRDIFYDEDAAYAEFKRRYGRKMLLQYFNDSSLRTL